MTDTSQGPTVPGSSVMEFRPAPASGRVRPMLVLALSTSTPRGSVALVRDGEVLGRAIYSELRAHAERLFAGIDEVCASAGVLRRQIELVACDVGPGSFTGVRVAVAAAMGIAISLDVPAVGVASVEAMAAAALAGAPVGARALAALDAQKDELFIGDYELDPSGALREVTPIVAITRSAAAPHLARALQLGHLVVGAGTALAGVEASSSTEEVTLPDAAFVARLGVLRASAALRHGSLAPVYVRPPDITLSGPVAHRPTGPSV